MMKSKRLALSAIAATGASVAALALTAGAADAALLTPCTGSNIAGQGSSLQKTAQISVWNVKFNTNPLGCAAPNPTPTATYTSTGSGAGLTAFGANDPATFDTNYQYVGTDDAPNAAQIANINAASGATNLTIPVTQAAIAIVFNPPANCVPTYTQPLNLEAVMRGASKSWYTLGAPDPACKKIFATRVVRADSSGTTYQLKHYLYARYQGPVLGSLTWQDLQSAANNTTWPGTTIASKAGGTGAPGSGSGGGDEVKTVANTPGTVGYADLATSRANLNFGPSPLHFARIGNSDSGAQSPSTNGESTTVANSNCSTANGAYSKLPSGTGDWSQVYSITKTSTKYPICTLTWDLALTNYTPKYGTAGQAFATTVHDYLKYIVTTASGAGQGDNQIHDYAPLAGDARSNASATVNLITG